ncbi:MAG TPA: SDR family oxidoreductase [Chloroflexia bacterium]|nr:SDR family oxidoreductase [Chloroflexia bacterium]
MQTFGDGVTVQSVAVAGATGRIGKLTLGLLLEKGYKVRAFARTEAQVEELLALGAQEAIQVDLEIISVEELATLLVGCKALISAIGMRPPMQANVIEAVENQGVRKMADAAKAAGIKRLILTSSIGASKPESIPFLTEVLRGKQKGEEYLLQSGLDYTIVRPGGLIDEPGGQPVLVGRGDTIRGRITRADVAAVLVSALEQPTASGQVIEIINSPEGKQVTDPTLFLS